MSIEPNDSTILLKLKPGFTESSLIFLREQGLLHYCLEDANSELNNLISKLIENATGVIEDSESNSPEYNGLVTGINYLLREGNKSVSDTLTNDEKLRILQLKENFNDASLNNILRLHPFVKYTDLVNIAKNISYSTIQADNTNLSSKRSKPSDKLQLHKLLEKLKDEANRHGCTIVRDRRNKLAKNTRPGNHHPALPISLQNIIIKLENDNQLRIHDLVCNWHSEDKLLYSNLTPRGRAAYWLLVEVPYENSQSHLSQTVSESYRLPSLQSYNFIVWDLICRFLSYSHFQSNHEIWKNTMILKKLGLDPLNKHISHSEQLSYKYQFKIKPRLIQMGVSQVELDKIEEKYISKLTDDFEDKHNDLKNNLMFIVAEFLLEEQPETCKQINFDLDQLLKRARDPDLSPILREQTASELKAIILHDPLAFILLYLQIYDVPESISLNREIYRKRGTKRPNTRLAFDTILCDLVDLVRNTKIRRPFDICAKVANSLLGSDEYSKMPTQSIGSRTTGGSVLKTEYYNLKREKR